MLILLIKVKKRKKTTNAFCVLIINKLINSLIFSVSLIGLKNVVTLKIKKVIFTNLLDYGEKMFDC